MMYVEITECAPPFENLSLDVDSSLPAHLQPLHSGCAGCAGHMPSGIDF